MKKQMGNRIDKKVIIGIVIAVCVVLIGIFAVIIIKKNDNTIKIRAVAIKEEEKLLTAMNAETKELLYVSCINLKGAKFSQGQEVLIYYKEPEVIFDVQIMAKKIEVVKEKSDIKVPDAFVKLCYNSPDAITAEVIDISSRGVTLEIVDDNELPYEFADRVYIFEKTTDYDHLKEVEKTLGIQDSAMIEEYETEDGTMIRRIDWTQRYGELGERKL